jgi:hypothetical protein
METFDNTNNPNTDPQAGKTGPGSGATEEARAIHGDKAREERYDQPEAVTLDGDTRIATEPATDARDDHSEGR